ncbi:MAG: Eco57I restriction-modification methylase domain-containing protein [Saprospiraceae bacterium]|nr:Eco57I restriction-modification methylase domain-containing protein [Saprospiraceae bacterium]
MKYKQEWREGEKAGKVSLLRDVDFNQPHAGHLRIIFGDGKEKGLQIDRKKIDSFDTLYKYWQEIFSVSLLNKKFYQELSNWYFWAIKHVTFPGEPKLADAHIKKANLDDLLQEHKATNVIRLLTRILFVWFIKEKKLIPDDLFDLKALQDDILNDISPYHEIGMFKDMNKESVYYKAILQNLFFATLNCPIQGDKLDNRKRSFRGDGYGTHRGIDYLMRYKSYFKNPDAFLEKLNSVVPFLNGGLFECLDDKENNTYIDGFSDQMTKGEQLIVPDYLFFGVEEEADLSDIVGISDKKYKQAAVKGLINILKSYKFTITENTPIEEEVALDPELLGKVFENLLASYNPETKTTARKQTGSFYTPREIVNYMVDESLITYLKNKILSEQSAYIEIGKTQTNLFGNEGKQGQQTFQMDINGSEFKGNVDELDVLLHELMSYNPGNPFKTYPNTTKLILEHLNKCTILDPACGSGAFPMGILQKMVHVLQKLDPNNTIWKEIQIEKAKKESDAVFEISDKQAREERLLEINEAFDQSINDPDYARKLFLIENCIYGVDIQPIATQISKLRFFISLVVEQKVIPEKENFGIRPLPNLETKFVAANTLIGIAKEHSLFYTDEIKNLEKDLKKVRHKLFSARSKDTKIKYRQKDKELRESIADILEQGGMPLDESKKLAAWDPYDQNASSPFFDPEWMFDIKEGFHVLIGNPPYVKGDAISQLKPEFKKRYESYTGNADLYVYFIDFGISLLNSKGVLSFITPNKWIQSNYGINLRKIIAEKELLKEFLDFGELPVFKEVSTFPSILMLIKQGSKTFTFSQFTNINDILIDFKKSSFNSASLNENQWAFTQDSSIVKDLIDMHPRLKDVLGRQLLAGVKTGANSILILDKSQVPEGEEFLYKKIVFGKDLEPYSIKETSQYLFYPYKFDNGKNNLLAIDSFKRTNEYFSSFKSQLTNRAIIKEGVKKGNKKWYELQQINMKFDYTLPKIIYPDISSKNKFVYDESGVIPDMTCFFIPTSSIEYIPILNSSIFWFLAAHFCPILGNFKEGGRIRFKSTYLENIPLPKLHLNSKKVLINLSQIMHMGAKFKNIADAISFNLYFPDHMKERGIDVLEFVERDFAEVLKGMEFESLSDPEKEDVIEALHAKWSHPDNEVRNRIKLFAVRSPEILKPILES